MPSSSSLALAGRIVAVALGLRPQRRLPSSERRSSSGSPRHRWRSRAGAAPRVGSTRSIRPSRVPSAPRSPTASIRWRYRLVANGFSVVLPRADVRLLAPAARCPSRLRERDLRHRVRAGRNDDPRLPALREHDPGERWWRESRSGSSTTASTRRTRSSIPPAHDAARLPEGAAGLHDRESDRRQGIPAPRRDLASRGEAVRPGGVRPRDARRRDRGGQREHSGRGAARERDRAPGAASATTRR